jgi:preprotein translocase subunit YajC
LNSLVTLAQTTAATQGGKEAPPLMQFLSSPMTFVLLGVLVLYIFMAKNKRGDEQKRKNMLAQLKKGDEIQTIGGIIGKVIEAREDRVLVKVDETANAKIWFSRNAIHRVLEEEKAESK